MKRIRDGPSPILENPKATALCFADLAEKDREVFCLGCLDVRNQLIARHTVFIGTTDTTLAHPREILRTALVAMATRIVVVHNHPSGVTSPSREDLEVTTKLAAACEIVGIELLDHVIIGRYGQYWSWVDAGKPEHL